MNLKEKLLAVNKAVTKVDKGGTNNFSKYDYCRLGDILEPLRPHLQELGLIVVQSIEPIDNKLEFMDNGYYTVSSCACLTTVFDTDSDDSLSVSSTGFSTDKNGDKAAYKATTGARKYGISALFCLDWDAVEPEDDRYDDKRPAVNRTKTTTNKRTIGRTY